jgi:hypothetical protein
MREIQLTLTEREIALICLMIANGSIFMATRQNEADAITRGQTRDIIIEGQALVDKLNGLAWPENLQTKKQ